MNRNRRLNYRFVAVLLLTHGPILRSAEPAPNLLIEINSRLVEPIAQMPVDRTENVRDYILKTDIFGIGHTVGRTRVEFVPCEACALFDVILEARTDSQTVGYRGPVRLHNANQSDIVACKRVRFDRDGIRSEPA